MNLSSAEQSELKEWCILSTLRLNEAKELYNKICNLPTMRHILLYKSFHPIFESHDELLEAIDFVMQ